MLVYIEGNMCMCTGFDDVSCFMQQRRCTFLEFCVRVLVCTRKVGRLRCVGEGAR